MVTGSLFSKAVAEDEITSWEKKLQTWRLESALRALGNLPPLSPSYFSLGKTKSPDQPIPEMAIKILQSALFDISAHQPQKNDLILKALEKLRCLLLPNTTGPAQSIIKKLIEEDCGISLAKFDDTVKGIKTKLGVQTEMKIKT